MPALTLCLAIDVIIPMATLWRRRIRCGHTVIGASSIRWHSGANGQYQKQRERCHRLLGLSRHDPLALWLFVTRLHCNCACNAAKAGFNWRDLPEFRRCVSTCRRSFPASRGTSRPQVATFPSDAVFYPRRKRVSEANFHPMSAASTPAGVRSLFALPDAAVCCHHQPFLMSAFWDKPDILRTL
jgi:hypothetical protein